MTYSYVWHSYVDHDSFVHVKALLIHVWDMTYPHMGHDCVTCGTWLIDMWDMAHAYMWHASLIRRQISSIDNSYMWHESSYVDHDSFVPVNSWLVYMCDMTYICVGHDLFICGTWRMHTCDMPHSYAGHDSVISKKPHLHSKGPYLWWKEIHFRSKEPFLV